MKLKKTRFFIIFSLLFLSLPAHATSLDEIYRDLVRSDNSGYLPMFVKNRNAPDFLLDDEAAKQIMPPTETKTIDMKAVNLESERLNREAALKAARLKWQNTLLAVKNNHVTPVELEEIQKHVNDNEPQAVELFAWMFARGIGVQTDLIRAFHLYRKAAALNVPNANNNAAQVYKAMTREQRESLNALKN